ncbi:lipopolysaccharide biosynthesis protein [Algoriphagus sp.]|uniref:lipopolysaccharide biosynthesis protein n=1 Tax=Algoriphagus sp. TaxID=1872435 RepID=UPI00391A3B3D
MENINSFLKFLKSNGRTAKAGKQVIYSFGLRSISIVISLLYVPLMLSYLSQEKYGIWLTLTSILGWFSFFDIGLGNGLRNNLAKAFSSGDLGLGRKYVSTTYAILICIFSFILFIFHISNFFLNWNSILNTQTIANSELYILTSIVFSFFLIRFVVALISVVYLADQKSSISHFISTIGSLLSFILVFLLTYSSIKENLILLGSIVSGIPAVIFIIISIISFTGKYRDIRPTLKEIDFKLSKDLMNLGAKFFFLQICSIVIFSTSSFFIAQFYGPKEVVAYNIVFTYFQIPIMVFSIVLSPVWSAVTDAHMKADFVWLKKTIKQLNILSGLFSFVIVLMLVFSQQIFKIWLNDKVLITYDLSIVMAFYTIIQIWIAPYSNFINGFGKINLTMILSFLGILVYLILIYLFSNLFASSTGVVLAIIGTSIIGSVTQPWQTYKILNRTAKGIWNN